MNKCNFSTYNCSLHLVVVVKVKKSMTVVGWVGKTTLKIHNLPCRSFLVALVFCQSIYQFVKVWCSGILCICHPNLILIYWDSCNCKNHQFGISSLYQQLFILLLLFCSSSDSRSLIWFFTSLYGPHYVTCSCENWRGNFVGSWNWFSYWWNCCCWKLGFSYAGKYIYPFYALTCYQVIE